MYNTIKSLIQHTWETATATSGEQQYIYFISGALIIVLTIFILDKIFDFIMNLAGRR